MFFPWHSSTICARPNGAAADVKRARAGALRAATVVAVVLLALVASSVGWGASTYNAAADMNSMLNTTQYSGATQWWNAGYTGAGVDVALIDSGVSPVAGLNTPGKVVYGPDLSLESQSPNLRNLDTYGHGTFMAGLIAGKDATYRGMAPDARIVSLKVATADGGTDVTQMIAAIDWVVQHAQDPGLNIRVINISYGTNSAQSSTVDPLAYAAEQAWKHGIVVVAAGGNAGFQSHMNNAPALSDPAIDRYVIAVGATDSQGTATIKDDHVTDFSPWPKRGATRSVDLVAPGAHLQGLRDPGSYIDVNNAKGQIDSRFFRGSGTSQAAAIVSGAAALILQKYPNATPDQVKALLTSTGYDINDKAQAIGGGELQLSAALAAPLPAAAQTWPVSTGTGSIELARGTDHIARDGVALIGEQDIFGMPFDSPTMAAQEAAASTWSGGAWNGSTWSGSTWSGSTWSASTWSGSSWSGSTWSSSTWSDSTWSGSTWSGSTWSGSSWSGSTWSGSTWSGDAWS